MAVPLLSDEMRNLNDSAIEAGLVDFELRLLPGLRLKIYIHCCGISGFDFYIRYGQVNGQGATNCLSYKGD